jgi:hypothetical protein
LGGEPDAPGNEPTPPAPSLRVVAADPRKFSAYVLVPGHPSGKDRIFLEVLNYRPRSEEDARALVTIYVAQASQRFTRREYVVGKRDRHGQRYTIAIELNERVVLTGWILRSDGTLWLATPFAGFADEKRSGT